MKELLIVLVGAALVNNVVLSQFLGLCPFIGVSKRTSTAAGMGGAVVFVITVASALTSVIYILLEKLDLTYMKTIVFIMLIAALVQFIEMILKKYSPSLYNALGVYLPLITTNCAVLGVSLTNVQKSNDFVTSVVYGVGTSIGFLIAIVIMAGVRERIEYNNITKSFQGYPIVLITAGLMSIAFMGFAGVL